MIQNLAAASNVEREALLTALPENDRSQLRRTMALFGLRSEDGHYDEIGLRRLANPAHRAHALRGLLDTHYGPELAVVHEGVDRQELEERLSVPGRSSPSSREKARQFSNGPWQKLTYPPTAYGLRPADHARMNTDNAATSPAHRGNATSLHAHDSSLNSRSTKEANRLERRFEDVSQRTERLLRT